MLRLKVCRVQKWALVAVLLPAAARRCYLFAPPPPSLPKRSTNYFYFISFMLPLLLPRLRLRLLLLRVKWPQDKHLQMFSQQRECVYGPCVPVCVCVCGFWFLFLQCGACNLHFPLWHLKTFQFAVWANNFHSEKLCANLRLPPFRCSVANRVNRMWPSCHTMWQPNKT